MNDAPPPSSRRRAILALIIVNAMWGISFPVMKCLNLQMDQFFGVTEETASGWLRVGSAAWMIGIRFGCALLLFLMVFHDLLRKVRWPHFWAGVAIGTLFFFGLLLQVIGLGSIPASRSGFLTSLAVVFTPLFSTIIRRQAPRLPVVLATVLALLGVAILTGLIVWKAGFPAIAEDALGRWTWGDTWTTLATVFFSGQILLVDHLGKRYHSSAFTPSMFATTTLLAFLTFGLLRTSIPEASAGGWLTLAMQPQFFSLIAVLCIFPSLLAFVWMNKYQPSLTASQAAVIYTFEPLFASSWAMFLPAILSVLCLVAYPNEPFTLPLIAGGTLVLLANLLALWPSKKADLVRVNCER